MSLFSKNIETILITGGSGFIGSNLVRKILKETDIKVYNLDKLSYASNDSISKEYKESNQYEFLKVDLYNEEDTKDAIKVSNPDLVFHLAAESHVDKSISEPNDFIKSNIVGTFNLLEGLLSHWDSISENRKKFFRLLHISTDEVFGSIKDGHLFSEETPYDPRSPYSASKASSDHLVRAWSNTYGLPSIITNSCNNFGPWQFPEKLIPVIIKNALYSKSIPIYGDGSNIRDWIYVDDHIDVLLEIIKKGTIGDSYCIGSGQQKTNEEVVQIICNFLDFYNKENAPHARLKKYIKDRPRHDKKYAIDNTKIINTLKWNPKYDFNKGIDLTVKWYLNNLEWLNSNDMNF